MSCIYSCLHKKLSDPLVKSNGNGLTLLLFFDVFLVMIRSSGMNIWSFIYFG